MITASSFWLNAATSLILCLFLSLFIIRLNDSGKKKVISIASIVVLSITLVIFNSYSLYGLQGKMTAFKLIKPKVIEVKDLSGLKDKKYLINVVVPSDLSKPELRDVVNKCTSMLEKTEGSAQIIWVAAYNKQLPEEELSPSKSNPYLVALTRKVNDNYNGVLTDYAFKSEENYKGLTIFWNK